MSFKAMHRRPRPVPAEHPAMDRLERDGGILLVVAASILVGGAAFVMCDFAPA